MRGEQERRVEPRRERLDIAAASSAVQEDLATALQANADTWLASLDDEEQQARRCAAEALRAFDAAIEQIVAAGAAAMWISSG